MATSYTNPCGSGDRRTTVLITASTGTVALPHLLTNLLDGNTADNNEYFSSFVTTGILEFWFPSKKIIDEAKFYQQNTTAHGTWKWQGSNDRTTWTDIGGTFTLGGVATQTFTSLAGNVTGYVFYRLFQTAGATSSSPYIHEFEFKIDEAPTSTTSYLNALGSGNRTATITITSSGITWLGAGAITTLVNGVRTVAVGENWWNADATNAGDWVQFDLGAAYVVQQARLFQDNIATQGDWKLQGSPDASTWTDISAAVTVGVATVPYVTCFGGGESNTTAYRYYRLLGVSGGRTTALYELEVEFMVAATATTGLALVASSSEYLGPTGGTTATAINTTGADLLVVSASYYWGGLPSITISDSKGNTWSALTDQRSGLGTATRLYYAKNATCGTGHTFTGATGGVSAWIGITVYAYSGSHLTAPFDVESGATGTGIPLAAGSITPSVAGCAVVSGFSAGDGTITGTPSGMTSVSNAVGAAAYVVQTAAAAINPSWTRSGGTQGAAASVAAFKPTATATPAASVRVTQDAIEVLSLPTPAARVTQSVVEVLATVVSVAPPTQALVTQAVVELLGVNPPPPTTRVTQQVVELLGLAIDTGRVTQLVVEAFVAQSTVTRASQIAVEVFHPILVPTRATQIAVEYFNQPLLNAMRTTHVIVEVFRLPLLPGPCPVDLPLDADSVNDCAIDFPTDPDVVPY